MKYDDLGKRMKLYEEVSKTKLIRKMPVVIRIDGKAFHHFTKGFIKPFDEVLMYSMWDTMLDLCSNIQGCIFGYTQSDEITLILSDFYNNRAEAWFDNEVQKICSISASMATYYFNKNFLKENSKFYSDANKTTMWIKHDNAIQHGAMFDSRCFNIPKEEVANLIYWREADCIRNSIQMTAHTYLSQKDVHGKNNDEIKSMLSSLSINWDSFEPFKKYGVCCKKVLTDVPVKNPSKNENNNETIKRYKWVIDKNIPIFKGEGRKYIEELLYSNETKGDN